MNEWVRDELIDALAPHEVAELATLARALNQGRDAVKAELDASTAAVASRRTSPRINDPKVQARAADADPVTVTEPEPGR